MTDKITIERETLEATIAALEEVDALIAYQFTGTRPAMTALQYACDHAAARVPPLRAALAAQPAEPKFICRKCGVDRFKQPCGGNFSMCPTMGVAAQPAPAAVPPKLWLWRNFVDGRPEYWAFDNPFPVHMDCGDPQTLGEPVGYALFKPSRSGRDDVSEAEVLRRIAAAAGDKP